jgi:hypothetical protein
MKRHILFFTLVAAVAIAAPLNEGARIGATYYMGRAGSTWNYAAGEKGKAKVTVESVENWAARFHVDWGKRSTSGTWRTREGAWVEKLPAHEQESIVLPAQLMVGSRWSGPTSLERGERGTSRFEVISMDAQVELPGGITRDGCVAVLESGDNGERPFTHFYAPNTGKVAVQGPEGWLLRLIEFRPGRGGAD